ncbi:MAG: helix-turn-helix domain-containing protein [Oscillospiraceae bacterium]
MNVYVALDLLAKAVREAREEQGLSQRELARRLSMNTRTIMDLEICRMTIRRAKPFSLSPVKLRHQLRCHRTRRHLSSEFGQRRCAGVFLRKRRC